MTHNETIELLVKEAASSDRKQLTELFLQTLSSGRLHFGLQVLSKMKTYHIHSFSQINISKTGDYLKDDRLRAKEFRKPVLEREYIAFEDMTKEQQDKIMANPSCPCHLCSCWLESDIRRYSYDPLHGLFGFDIYDMLQCLLQEKKECIDFSYTIQQRNEGLNILKDIFEVILSMQETDGIRDVYKSLKRSEFFKYWKKEEKRIGIDASFVLQCLLEIMGYLGILHTEKYRGAFYEYTDGCPPRSSGHSDWHYPVDFWRGKDSIDKSAFQYWFGEYKELEKFWK